MSRKVIDVSGYQGKIDWPKVKASGVEGAILKILQKDLTPDTQFEKNWKGCENAGIPIIGVYNYSYASTTAKARTAAKSVIQVLAGRKTGVWLDVEDGSLENLGKALPDIINAYADVIIGAGLSFGIYTGQHFYNTYLKPYSSINYPLWIARYGPNDGTLNKKYNPQIKGLAGWQYTSKGRVNGIFGYVDLNVWYEDVKTASGVYHTVTRGDTLSGIAKQYKTNVNRLMQLNSISNADKIYIGQKIRVK